MIANSQTSMQVRANLAATHLQSAGVAARKAHEIEQNNSTKQFGDWYSEMMQLVPVSIVMAGAALEAGANELMENMLQRGPDLAELRRRAASKDQDQAHHWQSTPLNPGLGARLQLEALKEDRSGNSLDKFTRIAWLFDKEPEKGMPPWQNADMLVQARNSLMHFRPVWVQVDAADQDTKLVNFLKSKVPISRVYTPLTFPFSFMTYGCAKWSVETVLAFSESFCALLGVADPFDPFRPSLKLPPVDESSV